MGGTAAMGGTAIATVHPAAKQVEVEHEGNTNKPLAALVQAALLNLWCE